MEDFRKLFHDEARDLVTKLEETLLLLEDDFDNKELINEVFRIMHSLKGSGAMFGFTNLSNFTHNLETLYDNIRGDKLHLNTDIITFTMECGDHISKLLSNDSNENLINETSELISQINQLIITDTNNDNMADDKNISKIEEPIEENKLNKSVFYIRFEPNQDIFNDGTNPLYLIDELVDLGDAIVKINHENLPDFSDINSEKCYLSWTIILSTSAEKDDIVDVFIFIEDDSNIIIEQLSELDLFSLKNTRTTFEYILNNKVGDQDDFLNIVAQLENDLNKTDSEAIVDIEPIINELDNQPKVSSKNKISIPSTINIDTVKVSSIKLDSLINLVSELVTTQAKLVTYANKEKSNEISELSEDFQHLSRQFRDIAFEMRLIPIHTMVVKFNRLVRDLSKSLGKKVSLITEGTETELDKNIISTLSDPIMHIIRNSIDHGIESPEQRLKNNKPETGTITLKAQHSGTSIIIEINDDGAGINTSEVIKKAISKDLINPGDELSENQIFNLLMKPGFTTNEVVTDVSGRGVGMDVVRKKILDLRGEVSITSEKGKGTSVIIKLPLTLSIIDGLLVSIVDECFVIPVSSVKQIYQVTLSDIQNSFNSIIDIGGVQYPYINLPKEFNKDSKLDDTMHFITVGYHDKVVGLIVNNLISEYQAVLKPIGSKLIDNEIFAGATILGDGKVALVLDTNKVIDFYSNRKKVEHDK